MIAAFFGPDPPDALTAHVSVFSHDFKRFERLTKLATSSIRAPTHALHMAQATGAATGSRDTRYPRDAMRWAVVVQSWMCIASVAQFLPVCRRSKGSKFLPKSPFVDREELQVTCADHRGAFQWDKKATACAPAGQHLASYKALGPGGPISRLRVPGRLVHNAVPGWDGASSSAVPGRHTSTPTRGRLWWTSWSFFWRKPGQTACRW